MALSKIRILRSFRSKKVLRFFGLKTAIFQILKTVQDQDRLGQDQDLKKMVLRPVLRTTSLVQNINCLFNSFFGLERARGALTTLAPSGCTVGPTFLLVLY